MFRILCLDGGGTRGYFSAKMLKKIEEKYNIKIYEYFDLIVGTSTGALLAGALALNIDLDEIINIYLNENEKIFTEKKSKLNNLIKKITKIENINLFSSIYDNEYLIELVNKTYKGNNFDKVKTNLIITATNISKKEPIIFKSWDNKNKISLIDAVISSSSAPVFFDPYKINGELYCDGCIWANNPSLVALTEILKDNNFNVKLDDIQMLSIGTGKNDENINNDNNYENIFDWSKDIVELTLKTNVISTVDITNKILNDKFVRLDYKSAEKLSINKLPKELLYNIDNIFENNINDLDKIFINKVNKTDLVKKDYSFFTKKICIIFFIIFVILLYRSY